MRRQDVRKVGGLYVILCIITMVVLFYGLCSKCQIQSYKLTSRRLQCNTTTIFIAGNLPNRLGRNVQTVLILLLRPL